MKKRTILVHAHMFKNAGTTLDWSLQRCFGDSFLDHRNNAAIRRDDGLRALILNKPHLRVISSHWVPLPLPKIDGIYLMTALVLRHPIERIASVYNFERKQESDTQGAQYAKKASFKQYVAWRMKSETGATIRDFQVKFCTSADFRPGDPVNEARFNRAVELLQTTPLVGLVEQFDQSMVLFEVSLKAWIPEIDLRYIRQNVNQGISTSLQEKVVGIEKELGSDLKMEVYEKNHYDLKLYEVAKGLLEDRVTNTPNFTTKLASLRGRCKSLQS